MDFAANTHSVSLNEFDLSKITTLTAEGLELKPVSAPVMGGHHVKGKIVFAVGRDLESFTITINGIPSVDERVYHWDKP